MPKIERIEVFVTDLPQRLQRQLAHGTWDTGPSKDILGKPVLVKLYAGGIVGYGQIRPFSPGHIAPETTQGMITAITELYGPRLLGRDLFDIEENSPIFDQVLPGNQAARAVLDHAQHDAMGKAVGLPVYSLLGGLCQADIPLEWSIGMADNPSEIIAEALRAVSDFGMRVLCVKAGDKRGWEHDVNNFVAVRRAVGDGVLLGIDPNTAWTVDTTIQALRRLEPYQVGYLEQPIERRDIEGLAEIRRQANGVPLMADESLFNLNDAFLLAKHRAVDALCIKLYKVGGLRAAKKIAAVAEASNIRLNAGGVCAVSQLEAAATAHFCSSLPRKQVMGAAEYVFGLGAFGPDPLVPETDFRVSDGFAKTPSAPGLGIMIDEQALKKLTLVREVVRP